MLLALLVNPMVLGPYSVSNVEKGATPNAYVHPGKLHLGGEV